MSRPHDIPKSARERAADKRALRVYYWILSVFAGLMFVHWWAYYNVESYVAFKRLESIVEHAAILVLIKIAQRNLRHVWQRASTDLIVAVLMGDIADRVLGVTSLQISDYFLYGVFVAGLLFKYSLLRWGTTKN